MSVTIAQFLEITDRLAKQREILGAAATAANVADPSSRKFWEDIVITDDFDFITILGTVGKRADLGITDDGIIGLGDVSFHSYNWFGELIEAIADWTNGILELTLDDYLEANVEQVSEYFDDLWFANKRVHLLALNAFCEQSFSLGDVEITAGPAVTFTDGTRLGTGTGYAGGTGATRNYAPAQFKAVVTNNPIGATDLDLTVTCTTGAGASENKDVVIPAGSIVGAEVNVGTSVNTYIDLTNAIYTVGGDQGTVGDTVQFQHIKYRDIAL